MIFKRLSTKNFLLHTNAFSYKKAVHKKNRLVGSFGQLFQIKLAPNTLFFSL